MQQKQSEWAWQWERLRHGSEWLFSEWIWPCTLDDFRGKDVLDAGCGGGQHLALVAELARTVVGVDLNASESARQNALRFSNVSIVEDDILTMDIGKSFDVVYCIGLLHHTNDPGLAFQNLTRHCRPGGCVIVWVYAREGNFWNRILLEPLKRIFVRHLPRRIVWFLAHVIECLLYPLVYTLYVLPLPFLPFYAYFANWRRLNYEQNFLNVFDKLNAPQTFFIDRAQVEHWFEPGYFEKVSITPYVGVSWRASGTKR